MALHVRRLNYALAPKLKQSRLIYHTSLLTNLQAESKNNKRLQVQRLSIPVEISNYRSYCSYDTEERYSSFFTYSKV